MVEISRYLLMSVLRLLAPAAGVLLAVTLAMQLAATQLGRQPEETGARSATAEPARAAARVATQNLPALLRAAIMLPLFGLAVYGIIRDNLFAYMALPFQGVESGFRQVCGSLGTLLWKACGVFLVFGAVDLFRQRRRYRKDLRMSKQEIRDEVKETEGNPQMKARIRRMQRDRLRHQMMKEVPKATAVIVNPDALRGGAALCHGFHGRAGGGGQREELSGAAHPPAGHGAPGADHRESAAGAGALQIGGRRAGDPARTCIARWRKSWPMFIKLMNGRLPG